MGSLLLRAVYTCDDGSQSRLYVGCAGNIGSRHIYPISQRTASTFRCSDNNKSCGCSVADHIAYALTSTRDQYGVIKVKEKSTRLKVSCSTIMPSSLFSPSLPLSYGTRTSA